MADGLFSGSKRSFAGGQGGRDDPEPMLGTRDASEPVIRATSDVLKGRKIMAPKSRRGGASGFSSRESSVDRQLGNPFAQLPNTQSFNTNASLFTGFGQQSQQQQTPMFGAGSTSQSFPSGGATFGQQLGSSFTFGASNQQSSSFPPPSSTANQPAPTFSFGTSASAPSGSTAFTFGSAAPQSNSQSSLFNFSSGGSNSTSINNPFSSISKEVQPSTSTQSTAAANPFGSTSQKIQPPLFGQSNGNSTPAATDSKSIVSGPLFGSTAQPSSTSSLFSFSNNATTTTTLITPKAPQTDSPSASVANIDDIMTSPPVTPEKPAVAATTTPLSKTSFFQPSSNIFASATAPSSIQTTATTGETAGASQPKASFSPQTQKVPAAASSLFQPSSLFGQAATQAPTPSPITPEAAATQPNNDKPASLFSSFAPAPTPEAHTHSSKTENRSAKAILAEADTALGSLNQAFKARLSNLKETDDWSPMLRTYLGQMDQLRKSILAKTGSKRTAEGNGETSDRSKRARASESVPNSVVKADIPSEASLSSSSSAPQHSAFNTQSTTPPASPSKSQTANLFASIVGNGSTPKTAAKSEPSNPFGTSNGAAPTFKAASTSNLFGRTYGDASVANSDASQNNNPGLFGSINGNTSKPADDTQSTNLFAQFGKPAQNSSFSSSSFKVSSEGTETTSTSNPFASASNLFPTQGQSTDSPSFATPSETSNPFANVAKGPSPTTFLNNSVSVFKPAEPSPGTASSAASSVFANAKFTDSTASMPKFEMPKFSASAGGNAFAAFGAQAQKQQEKSDIEAEQKELEKRFDDDYDSDKEDEATFNKRVLAEIRAERAKAKAQKSTPTAQVAFDPTKGFSFGSNTTSSDKNGESQETPPSSAGSAPAIAKSIFETGSRSVSSVPNLFGHLSQSAGQDDSDDSDNEQTSNAPSQTDSTGNNGLGKSLFDRVTKAGSSDAASDSDSASADKTNGVNGDAVRSNAFSSSGTFGQKSTTEDHTWKTDSPIKFGTNSESSTPTKTNGSATATPAPKSFTNIFGENKPNATPSLFGQALAKPAFNFGASSNGNATPISSISPASTREGSVQNNAEEASAAEGTDANNLDGATPDVQVSLSDLTEDERRNNDVLFDVAAARVQVYDTKSKSWERRGTGPLRVLKNKETGRIQVLGRSNPQGKILINSPLLKGLKYEMPAKGRVKLPAVVQDGKVTTMLITVKSEDAAQRLVQVCEENKPT